MLIMHKITLFSWNFIQKNHIFAKIFFSYAEIDNARVESSGCR